MENKRWLNDFTAERLQRKETIFVGQKIRIGDETEGNRHSVKQGEIIAICKEHIVIQLKNYKETYRYADMITSLTNYTKENRVGEKLFNVKFGNEYKRITPDMIPFFTKVIKEKIKVRVDTCTPGTKRDKYHQWTTEQIKYLMEHKATVLRNDLKDDFNIKFGTNLTVDQINSCIKREKYKTFK